MAVPGERGMWVCAGFIGGGSIHVVILADRRPARCANVNHFFTLLGKMFFTPYGKQFFTSLFLPVGKGQGASAGRIPRGKSNTWHGAGSGPALQW